MTRVLVSSAYPAMRAGLRALLEADRQIQVAGEAADDEELLGLAHALAPDVLLLDAGPEADGLEVLWRLRREAPRVPVVVLTDSPDDSRILPALQAGALGCLPKTSTGPELERAIKAAASGESVLYPASAAALLERLRSEPGPAESLTARESEVLQWVAAGLTNKAVAYRLGISEHTVKFHLSSAMNKLGAASRAEAVAIAIRLGLISI